MSALTRAIAIRPGEGRTVVLVAGAFAAVEAGRGLGEVGVDTLVLNTIGAGILPTLYIALGLVGLVVTLGYGAVLSRSISERFFPALLVLIAGVLGLESLLALSGFEGIYPLVWVTVYAAGMLLLTAIWTIGGFVFDARQAKRLFPLLTSSAIVGSLAGFLSAIVVERILGGAQALIAAEALLMVVAAVMVIGLGPRTRPRRALGASTPSVRSALTDGAAYVARSRLMRLVAIAYVLLAVLMFSLTFPFMAAMSDAYPDESELLTVLALFSARFRSRRSPCRARSRDGRRRAGAGDGAGPTDVARGGRGLLRGVRADVRLALSYPGSGSFGPARVATAVGRSVACSRQRWA